MADAITKSYQPRAKEGVPKMSLCLGCCLAVLFLLFLIWACINDLFWCSTPSPAPSLPVLKSTPIPDTSPAQSPNTSPAQSPNTSPVQSPNTSPVQAPNSTPLVSPSAPPPPTVSSISKRPIPQPPDDDKNLRDTNFNINVPESEQEIRICVRDHSCEDGDRIRLLINGGEVYIGEIYNEPSCVIVPVHSEENSLQLYAINGTGGKGNDCSYEPINTGQIIIQGINWESAKWGLSPGSSNFSKVNIILK